MSAVEEIPAAESSPVDVERTEARRRKINAVAVPLATAAALIAIWQIGVRAFAVPTYIAPAPSDVARTLVQEFPLLMQNFWPTLYESLLGFAVGNTAAVLIAVAFVHSRMVERAFFPIAVFINTIPILAIAPILVLIFGAGLTAKVVIAALICFFPTLVNMVRGLQSVQKIEPLQTRPGSGMDGKYNRVAGGQYQQRIDQRLQNRRVVDIGRPMQGDDAVAVSVQSHLLPGAGGLDFRAHHFQ